MSWFMAAFAVSSVLGMPLGIYMATEFIWNAPFYFICGLGTILLVVGFFLLPSITKHLEKGLERIPFRQVFNNALTTPNQYYSFLLTFFLVLGQFTLIPNVSRYMVANVGFTEEDLKYIYLVGGALTIFTTPMIGKLCDKYPRTRIFNIFIFLSFIPIYIITHMGPWPMWQVLIITGLFFIFLSGRFIPVNTIVASAVHPNERAGFMSINTAFREFSAALSAMLAGWIIQDMPDGSLANFEIIGYLTIGVSLVCIFIAKRIKTVS